METIRQKKLADQIKKLVSSVIERKVRDPEIGFVTLTHVKVSRDLRIASIYFTVLGDEENLAQTRRALERARGFIRNEISPSIKARFIPELRFFADDTMEYANKIEKILKDLNKPEDEE